MTLKLSKNETKQLLDSLGRARTNGIKTPEGFLNYLDCESGYYLMRAREHEQKVAQCSKSFGIREAYRRISKRLRHAARITKRLHTKILENRNN